MMSTFIEAAYGENSSLKPIYLFADSQLLFWREGGELFLGSIPGLFNHRPLKAAYLGASNGDNPDFFSVFVAAMEGIGVTDCRMISSSFTEEDGAALDRADIILLAGGDVEKGWRVFVEKGIRERIVRRYFEGALLMGVSAGAVQLGSYGWSEEGLSNGEVIETFRLLPFIVGAHQEEEGWESLKRALLLVGGGAHAVGLPRGGGAIFHADRTLEPVRHSAHEFSLSGDDIRHNLLSQAVDVDATSEVC